MKAREAVVTLASLDLRRRPDHRAELGSQLLMGEPVRVLRRTRDGEWARVESRRDGYRGWARTWGLRSLEDTGTRRWMERARARVRQHYAEVRDRPGAGDLVSPVLWNARLVPGETRGRWRAVELPDGRRGWIESGALGPLRPRARALETIVGELLGIPYLWGGRTPLGFDCSGFVQQVFAERGQPLPRDAHDQFRVSRPLGPGERPRAGDLVFFGKGPRVGHVGILLRGGRFAHARGQVRINQLDQDKPLWDKALMASFRGVRRPPTSPPVGSHSY